MKITLILFSILFFMFALSSCVLIVPTEDSESYSDNEPPAPQYESRPSPPGHNYVWIEGHWYWNGSSWIWIQGHYKKAQGNHQTWAPGRWERRHNRWVWIPGRWQ